MFRLDEKLKYMFFAGLLAFAGFLFGNMNSNTEAQSGSETIDELTVRKLTVLEDITVVADDGERRVVISWDENGGRVTCLDSEGMRAASLSMDEIGGMVVVRSEKGGGASLGVDEEGGNGGVSPVTDGQGGAGLLILEGDGVVFTSDRFGNITELN